MKKEIVSILGCGWYGLAMAKALIASGYEVNGSTTSVEKLPVLKQAGIKPYLVNFELAQVHFEKTFFDCDILIISLPPKRNSLDHPIKIKEIASIAEKAGVKQIILISSTGVYQNGNFVVNEDIIPIPDSDAGKALLEAENILKQYPFTTTIIRFAGLIGPGRNLAQHFAGKTAIANGLAPVNLIHLTDCIGITKAIIQQKAFGHIYHGVSPEHPSRKEFYTKKCITSGLAKPKFKDELLPWKQIESINVPKILGYQAYAILDTYEV